MFRVISVGLLPILVMIALATRGDSTGNVELGLLVNTALIAAPQILWLLLLSLCRVTTRVLDVGLLAADLVLIAFGVAMFFSPTRAALVWLFYFPIVSFAMLIGALVGKLTLRRI